MPKQERKPKLKEDKSKFVRLERRLVEEVSNFLFALGNQFVNVKNAEGAFDCFKYSIDLNKQNQPSVYNLGALYNVVGNFEGAYRMFAEASRMNPSDLNAKIALGEVARKLNKVDEAKEILDAAYTKDPENFVVLAAMSILHYDLGHLAEAVKWNSKALEKRPTDLHLLLNNALVNMTFGRWTEYWKDYEYLLSYQKNERMRGMKLANAWAGQEMEGKTLLVISDQGYGDAVQFARYLGEAKELGKFSKLIYLVQTDLISLMQRIGGIDEVVGFGDSMSAEFDTFSSLLGIMRILGISPQNCWRKPHIVTDNEWDARWHHVVSQAWDKKSKKVGIVWAGDPKHGNDHARSLSLSQFLSATAGIAGVQLFSFQVGRAAKQLDVLSADKSLPQVVDLAQDFRDFDDTASALRQMDLLISCDTSTPHLASGLGIPTWFLLSTPSEWRWLVDVSTTPWYRTAKLFRQQVPKDWGSTINAVRERLEEEVAATK